MTQNEKRRSWRVQCTIPVRVLGPWAWPPFVVLDISRSGVRLGIGPGELGVEEPATLGQVAERLQEMLQGHLRIQLHPERLGSLLERDLHVVRLAPAAREGDVFEVGARLEPPLGPEEAAALGLPLLASGTDPSAPPRPPRPAPPPPAPAVARADPTPRASVIPRGWRQLAPLPGRPRELGEHGGTLWVMEPGGCPPWRRHPVLDHVAAFQRHYGREVDLLLEAGGRRLFRGLVDVRSVEEVEGEPSAFLVGFTFRRPLEAPERQALGLRA